MTTYGLFLRSRCAADRSKRDTAETVSDRGKTMFRLSVVSTLLLECGCEPSVSRGASDCLVRLNCLMVLSLRCLASSLRLYAITNQSHSSPRSTASCRVMMPYASPLSSKGALTSHMPSPSSGCNRRSSVRTEYVPVRANRSWNGIS